MIVPVDPSLRVESRASPPGWTGETPVAPPRDQSRGDAPQSRPRVVRFSLTRFSPGHVLMNSKPAAVVVTLWILTLSLAAAQPHPAPPSKSESPPPSPPKVTFVDIAERAGLTAKTEDGGDKTKRYIIETTGSGAAFLDFDNDGWPDIFLVNGSRLEGFPKGQEPTSHLYRNNR